MRATMTAETLDTATATGRIARITGAVVDVEFSVETMPEIYNALTAEVTLGGETRTLTFEVAQHIGDNMVRAVALQPTDGLVRGAPVVDTSARNTGGAFKLSTILAWERSDVRNSSRLAASFWFCRKARIFSRICGSSLLICALLSW